jgi:hypothetical protein
MHSLVAQRKRCSQSGVGHPLKALDLWGGKSMKKDRERVTAEITLSHLMRQGYEQGLAPVFLPSVRSVAILLQWLHAAVVKPCHGMTIGAEHCRAGHVQA